MTEIARGSWRRITIERTYGVAPEEVFALWTTKAGIESWWPPDGFTAEVHKLELDNLNKAHRHSTRQAPRG